MAMPPKRSPTARRRPQGDQAKALPVPVIFSESSLGPGFQGGEGDPWGCLELAITLGVSVSVHCTWDRNSDPDPQLTQMNGTGHGRVGPLTAI